MELNNYNYALDCTKASPTKGKDRRQSINLDEKTNHWEVKLSTIRNNLGYKLDNVVLELSSVSISTDWWNEMEIKGMEWNNIMLPVFGYFVMKWINVSISLFEKKMESKVIALLEYPITSN